ncbi:unnamed protein product [Eruca vesicaria subsp. sativa]|uniref:CUE domain-containing protein n=1 Tax=Eruca vesicaria subsp. sativa TaxID=29727 RepID=A0ABC8K764_ERUVS|nr:unnamed protein product [Eruca vesicaria subsp. sativa]
MSHRRSNQQDQNNKYIPKSQQKFVPKPFNPPPPPTTSTSTPFPVSLSSSLRQSDSSSSSSRGSTPGGSRVRIGDQGQLVAQGGGSFVNYLPQDEAVAAGLGPEDGGLDPVESQRVVDLLNRELMRLLKLNPRLFWREVASDASLHEFLDSFLQFRSRWYDFPFHGVKGIVAGVIVGEVELCRRVFMVLFRISSNRDPGARAADSLTQKDHEVLLQEKKLLDLPKLLDICAIYGHENPELTKSLIENAVKSQVGIPDNLKTMLSHFLGILHTMHRRCTSSLETLFSTANSEDHGSKQLHSDLLEVMDFINDGVVSLDAFTSAYSAAALILACPVETSYGRDELLSSLVRLHDSLFPSFHRGFQVLFKDGDHDSLSEISTSLNMLSTRIGSLCWKILDICYLSSDLLDQESSIPAVTKMFPSRVEDPMVRADILIQTFREISGLSEQSLESKNRLLQKIEKTYRITDRLRSLQNAGWISMEDEQLQYLSMIMSYSGGTISVKEAPLLLTDGRNTTELMDENAIVMQSKISQIKDIFPEYGNGFLAACLEAYNQNPEEVIQRILEGTLHEDLQRLDTSSETMPQPKSAPALGSKDKGKGKLIDSDTSSSGIYTEQPITRPSLPASSASSAAVGRFVRKPKDDDTPSYKILDARKESDRERNAALLAQYEYDDEYDDSFDDLGFSVGESATGESESFGNRGGPAETEPSAASKWGSKKNPQFYVKDGKNYSYKVAGSVAVANANEASLVNEAQEDMIFGLGRGGNLPLGAVRKLTEYQSQRDDKGQSNVNAVSDGRDNGRSGRGRGRGGRGMGREQTQGKSNDNSNNSDGVTEAENGGGRGRGRGRRGGGGGRNHNHKDRAMKKHIASVSGF